MSGRLRSGLVGALSATTALVVASPAFASNGFDSPEVGVDGLGRGNAWLVKSNTPLAAYMNPAALTRQSSGLHVGGHLMFVDQCFQRKAAGGGNVSPGNNIPGPGEDRGPDADVCTDAVFPNPQIAGNWRFHKDWAVGFAVLGPHAVGNLQWPESVPYDSPAETQPAPNRYLLVESNALLIFPTLSVSYRVHEDVSLGAGFVWGIASIDFTTFVESLSTGTDDADNFENDVKAKLSATDAFVPGFVLGGLWNVTDRFELGAWYRWSDAIRSQTSLELESLYWGLNGTPDENPCAGQDEGCNLTSVDDAGTFKINIPMEAKLGLRYRHPRSNPGKAPDWVDAEAGVRDSLSQDLFDIEVDLTWANNSAVDNVEIRFKDGIAVNGTPGTVPPNGDIPHEWRDVLGVRVGGDVVVLEDLLALRAGGFFEGKGQDDEYLNLDFHMGEKIGLSGGGTVRLGPVDVSVAYQHTFYGTLDNGGNGRVRALSGDRSTGGRSRQTINGGRFESSLNELALGGTLHF